jgi:hypothetical protein
LTVFIIYFLPLLTVFIIDFLPLLTVFHYWLFFTSDCFPLLDFFYFWLFSTFDCFPLSNVFHYWLISTIDCFPFLFRLLPSDGTVDSEGVQLGGKRAALNYVHRIRNAIKTDEKERRIWAVIYSDIIVISELLNVTFCLRSTAKLWADVLGITFWIVENLIGGKSLKNYYELSFISFYIFPLVLGHSNVYGESCPKRPFFKHNNLTFYLRVFTCAYNLASEFMNNLHANRIRL